LSWAFLLLTLFLSVNLTFVIIIAIIVIIGPGGCLFPRLFLLRFLHGTPISDGLLHNGHG